MPVSRNGRQLSLKILLAALYGSLSMHNRDILFQFGAHRYQPIYWGEQLDGPPLASCTEDPQLWKIYLNNSLSFLPLWTLTCGKSTAKPMLQCPTYFLSVISTLVPVFNVLSVIIFSSICQPPFISTKRTLQMAGRQWLYWGDLREIQIFVFLRSELHFHTMLEML